MIQPTDAAETEKALEVHQQRAEQLISAQLLARAGVKILSDQAPVEQPHQVAGSHE